MLTQLTQIRTGQNDYRLAWVNPAVKGTQYGTYLFNEPKEASTAIKLLKKQFPNYIIWLEDREHNRIPVL